MHMYYPTSLYRMCGVLLILLFCTGISSAAPSDHPVVTAITGPNNLNNGYGATGSYVFIAAVSGGSPPYTYTWMNPPGIKTLYQGKEYSSVTIPANQLSLSSGPGTYGVWLTVTDSAGRDAVWQREGGVGNSNQFFYGLTYTDYPEPKWTITTEPKVFPKAPASSVTATPTTLPPGCKDSGVRFTAINGQVEVFSECRDSNWQTTILTDSNWKFAQRDTVLFYDDHIKTGEDSTATVGFADMSTFVLKPESEIVVASPPDEANWKVKLKLVLGNVWINTKKIIEGGSMEVETNQAVAGIKGTTFVVSTDGKTDTVQVIESQVEVTGKADGKKVTISGGQQVSATGSGVGSPTTFDVAAVTADWESVKAKTMAGKPAETPTQKSAPASALLITGIGLAAAAVAIRRM